MFEGHVPPRFWDTAVTTAVYLLNRMPTRVLDFKTPLEALSSFVPLPSVMTLSPRMFGCVVFVHIHKVHRTKLDPCAVRCLFVGYGMHQKGYRCYDPHTRKTYVTMDVTFLEGESYYPSPTSSVQGERIDERKNWWECMDVGGELIGGVGRRDGLAQVSGIDGPTQVLTAPVLNQT